VPNGISVGSAIFVWVPNAMPYNALSVGKKTLKNVSSRQDFVTLSEEDQATAIGNMHRNTGKDRLCGSGDMLADRQTDMLITVLCHRSRGRSDDNDSDDDGGVKMVTVTVCL